MIAQLPTCVVRAMMINKSPLPSSCSPGETLNSSPSIMTLSANRSSYDPCTVILISSASALAITPSHISGASHPLDNLMMQRALPPPPSFLLLLLLLEGSNFSLFFQTNIGKGCSLRTLLSEATYLLLFTGALAV